MTSVEANKKPGSGSSLPKTLTALAAVITAIGGLVTVLYTTGVFSQMESGNGGDRSQSATWIVRLQNVDDHGFAYLNGNRVLECHIKRERLCEIDITNRLRPGTNTLRIEFVNDLWGWTYQYQILRNGEIWTEDKCGRAGHEGCNNEDHTTGTVLEREFEIVP